MNSYKPPKVLREWTRDIPDGELYKLYIFDDKSVCSASGRYAHSSGSSTCSWSEFLAGSLNEVVQTTMGETILDESRQFIQGANRG
jgi:hypothetical protein